MIFHGNKALNRLTLANYVLNFLLQIMGVAVITSIVKQYEVYDMEQTKLPIYIEALAFIQKLLFSFIVLTQAFEWLMYIFMMRYQGRLKLEEMDCS